MSVFQRVAKMVDDLEINIFDDLPAPEEAVISQRLEPTAIEKYKEVKAIFDENRGYLNPYQHFPHLKDKISGKEFNELIDSGEFKNPENKHNVWVVNNIFRKPAQDQDMLRAQAKLLIGHDFPISNREISRHFTAAIEQGEFEYLKAVMEEPKVAHVFLDQNEAKQRGQDMSLSMFEREQASNLASSNRQALQGLYFYRTGETKQLNKTYHSIAYEALQHRLDNDVAETIIRKQPAVADLLATQVKFFDENKFAKLISTEEIFDSFTTKSRDAIIVEQIIKMKRDSQPNDSSYPIALQFMKFSKNENEKKYLVDTAISKGCSKFLNDVALRTDIRFDTEQLKSMKEKPELFSEVLHNSSKKELHDKLTVTMAPRQKAKALKI